MATVKTKFNLGAVEARVKSELRDNMAAATLFVEGEATTILSRGGRSGWLYKRGSRMHQASAPGEPPASDTGRPQGSLGSEVLVRAKEVVGVIFAGTDYARVLELGTPKLRPRPFLRPAILNNKRTILSLLRRK